MTEFIKSSEGIGPAPLLRDVLVNTHFEPGRVLPSSVQEINLGVFTDEARSLANASFLHDQNFVKPIYVTGSEKVLIPNTSFTKADSDKILVVTATSTMPKLEAKKRHLDSRYLAMLMSTSSNNDNQTSLTGHGLLLLADSELQAPSAAFTVGRTKNMVTFRGVNTPQLSEEEVNKKMKLWSWQIKNRFDQFFNNNMTADQAREMHDKIIKAIFKQIVNTYDLQYFEGESDQDVVTRTQP